jgi:hypothetical protein
MTPHTCRGAPEGWCARNLRGHENASDRMGGPR